MTARQAAAVRRHGSQPAERRARGRWTGRHDEGWVATGSGGVSYYDVGVDWTELLTPLLALIGALVGGFLTQLTGGRVAERREDRRLLREARVALERWVATRHGPIALEYPGTPPEHMAKITEQSRADFFQRHFTATVEAKAALGAVRRFDDRIGRVLDQDRWDLPMESIGELREALTLAERRAKLLARETKNRPLDAASR